MWHSGPGDLERRRQGVEKEMAVAMVNDDKVGDGEDKRGLASEELSQAELDIITWSSGPQTCSEVGHNLKSKNLHF